jgi:hypothetical protein
MAVPIPKDGGIRTALDGTIWIHSEAKLYVRLSWSQLLRCYDLNNELFFSISGGANLQARRLEAAWYTYFHSTPVFLVPLLSCNLV